MSEFLMGFDVLALGALLGALLLFGAVIWVLVDNRPLEDLNRRPAQSGTRLPDRGPDSPKPPARPTPSRGDGRGGRAA